MGAPALCTTLIAFALIITTFITDFACMFLRCDCVFMYQQGVVREAHSGELVVSCNAHGFYGAATVVEPNLGHVHEVGCSCKIQAR